MGSSRLWNNLLIQMSLPGKVPSVGPRAHAIPGSHGALPVIVQHALCVLLFAGEVRGHSAARYSPTSETCPHGTKGPAGARWSSPENTPSSFTAMARTFPTGGGLGLRPSPQPGPPWIVQFGCGTLFSSVQPFPASRHIRLPPPPPNRFHYPFPVLSGSCRLMAN